MLSFLSTVLEDWCQLNAVPFMSADDILHDDTINLNVKQRDWLHRYIDIWDIIEQNYT